MSAWQNHVHKLWRVKQALADLCCRCTSPAVEGLSLCEKHRRIIRAESKQRSDRARGGPPMRPCTCGRCGGLGHNSRTCTAESRRSA